MNRRSVFFMTGCFRKKAYG